MAIYNLGSINIDNFYQVPHISAGETIAAGHMSVGLGGKGANMSVASAAVPPVLCILVPLRRKRDA